MYKQQTKHRNIQKAWIQAVIQAGIPKTGPIDQNSPETLQVIFKSIRGL